MERSLEHQNVLVVGGSSGIGLAVARLARQNGAHVIIASRGAATQVDALQDASDSFDACQFDITSPRDHERLFDTIGRIDHLVVSVRPEIHPAHFPNVDIDDAKRAFEVKFWGPYRLIQTARCHLNDAGSITLTSGIAGEKVYAGHSTMALINSATETLCRSLAVELAPLRVNCVSPGFVEPKAPSVQEYARQFPAQRLASSDEVASAYLLLMTHSYLTGNIMVVDGGARLL